MASFKSFVRVAALGAAAIGAASTAHAQYAMEVYGTGAARSCYEAVKNRQLTLSTLQICTQALSDDTLTARNRAATFNNRGIVYMRRGDLESATRDYDKALSISPNIAETQINLGAMFYANGMYTESVAALNEGVKAEDLMSRAAAHYNRALSLEKLGEVDEAYSDYQAAVRLRPDFQAAMQQLGRYTVVPKAS